MLKGPIDHKIFRLCMHPCIRYIKLTITFFKSKLLGLIKCINYTRVQIQIFFLFSNYIFDKYGILIKLFKMYFSRELRFMIQFFYINNLE